MPLDISDNKRSVTFGTYNDVAGNQKNRTTNINNINGDQFTVKNVKEISVLDVLQQAAIKCASHNSSHRHPPSRCLETTRHEVLAKACSWMKNPGSCRILWITGAAGVGKSSLAQTLAELCHQSKSLGGSFFFSQDDDMRNSHRLFFTTIACQLHDVWPPLKKRTKTLLKHNAFIPNSSPYEQLLNLILKPLQDRKLANFRAKILPNEDILKQKVVIVDSIDECGDNDAAAELAMLLIQAANATGTSIPLLFIVTSQPGSVIGNRFKESNVVSELRLNDYDPNLDIELLLRSRLTRISNTHRFEAPWPRETEIQQLITQTSGLFLYATIVLKFIETKNGDPRRRLNIILGVDQGDIDQSVYSDIDKLYRRILAEIPQEEYDHLVRDVVGLASLVVQPLRAEAFDELLDIGHGETWRAMQGLHAFFDIPDHDHTSQHRNIRLVHTIFRQFIAQPIRSGPFFIDPIAQHCKISHLCFELMAKSLRQNMCNIQNPDVPNSQISGLPEARKDFFSDALVYAVRYWPRHFAQSGASASVLIHDLVNFANGTVLYWVEGLSLLEATASAVPALRGTLKLLKSSANVPNKTIQTLERLGALVEAHFDHIRDKALQIYVLNSLPSSGRDIVDDPSLPNETVGSNDATKHGNPLEVDGLDSRETMGAGAVTSFDKPTKDNHAASPERTDILRVQSLSTYNQQTRREEPPVLPSTKRIDNSKLANTDEFWGGTEGSDRPNQVQVDMSRLYDGLDSESGGFSSDSSESDSTSDSEVEGEILHVKGEPDVKIVVEPPVTDGTPQTRASKHQTPSGEATHNDGTGSSGGEDTSARLIRKLYQKLETSHSALAEKEDSWSSRYSESQEAHSRELQTLRRIHDQKIQEMFATINSLRTSLDKKSKDEELEKERFRNLQGTHDRQLRALNRSHARIVDNMQEDYACLQDAHIRDIQAVRTELEIAKATLRTLHSAAEEVERTHERELSAMNRAHAQIIQVLRGNAEEDAQIIHQRGGTRPYGARV